MSLFIISCLALSFIIQSHSAYLPLLTSSIALYTGYTLIAISALCTLIKQVHFSLSYDGFAVGALLTWFAYWQTLFNPEAPMFYFFPLFFALVAAVITFLFIKRDDWLDLENIKAMQVFSRVFRFHAVIIAITVLISIATYSHFLLFPTTMMLFILSYAFTSYLSKHQ